jgi:hypothetical protein
VLSNIRYYNQTFSGQDDTNITGTVHLRAKDGGTMDGITFRGVQLINTYTSAFTANASCTTDCTTNGQIKNVVFQSGLMTSPTTGAAGNINLYGTESVTFQGSVINGAFAGAPYVMVVGLDNNLGNPRTVSKLKLIGNVFQNLASSSTALELRNVAGADISGNIFKPASGATSIQGIKFTISGVNGPGTTDISVIGNTLNGLTTPMNFQCNGTTTNIAAYNIGDAGHTCP